MDAASRGEGFEVLPNKESLSPSKSDMIVNNGEISIDKSTALHRGLKSRHTTMIGEFERSYILTAVANRVLQHWVARWALVSSSAPAQHLQAQAQPLS